ncbi:MAG: FapA family protein [Fibromonadaceae bacterium]|jgi:uncharacterized protein (DUF342 family)|nr:FapA family protein [Fibromonadaceae bacterium]
MGIMDDDEIDEEPETEAESKQTSKVNRFKIAVSKDLMEVKLYPLIQVTDGALSTFEDIVEACQREGIKVELDEKTIEKQLISATPIETTIAKGIKPTDGKDGHLDYMVDMSAKPQFIADAKEDSIDFKNSMQVTLVNVGDVLASVVPPTDGEDGMDVRGAVIKAKPGEKAKFYLGEGAEEKDDLITVTAAGTPSIQDNVIMIRRTYVLQGDVNLSTGNITFPGTVIIHGNVTEGFEVISEENVVVNGFISGATVKAKGYIKCAGGIQGKEKNEITAGSYIAAKFISAATVTADGDILVTKDILHSKVNCLGELRIGGSLIGGVATALKGLECGGLGSETGVKTIVNIRTHYRQEKAKEQINLVMAEVSLIFDRYKVWNKAESISEDDGKRLLQDIANMQILIQKRQKFDGLVAKFDRIVLENKTAKAKVLGIFEADVVISSPFSRYTSNTHMKGPLALSENNEFQKMAIMKGGV